jgi:hypothetical protein
MANKEHHPEYGRMPGNQEPNTPGVNESEQGHRGHERREQQGQGGHHPEWGKVPGNQEPNTPGVRESDQRRK